MLERWNILERSVSTESEHRPNVVLTESEHRPNAVLLAGMMFGARIEGALSGMNWDVRLAGTPEAAWTAIRDAAPRLVVVELGAGSPARIEFVRALRSASSHRDLPILAFGSHKARSVLEEARAAGASLVVSNGLLVARFPELIGRVVGDAVGDEISAQERLLTEDDGMAEV